MSREDTYTDACAIAMDKMAKTVADRMDRAGVDWEDQPELVDLWRMYKWCADVEEAHGKMIHGNIATRSGVPDLVGEDAKGYTEGDCREIMDEVTEINNRLSEITEEWKSLKWRLIEVSDHLRSKQQERDQAARKAEMEETIRKKKVADMRKAGRLGF